MSGTTIHAEAVYSAATEEDMAVVSRLYPYTTPGKVPISFRYGKTMVHGIPDSFSPTATTETENGVTKTTVTGTDDKGLTITAVCTQYEGFPIVEWVAYLTNNGSADTEIISDLKVFDGNFEGTDPTLVYSNGDDRSYNLLAEFRKPIEKTVVLRPSMGFSSAETFPYMKLLFKEYGVSVAVGWSGQWEVSTSPTKNGATFYAKQQRTSMKILPGETMRTPSITLVGYTNEERGINIYRRFYFEHVTPKVDGETPSPLSLVSAGDMCTETIESQLKYLNNHVLYSGVRAPDVWWVDAGWYTKNGTTDWFGSVNDWTVDTSRFPNGLGELADAAHGYGMDFLLWFEFERTNSESPMYKEHPSYFMSGNGSNLMIKLNDPEAKAYMIDLLDNRIKEYKVDFFRIDSNTNNLLDVWSHNEAKDRVGAVENLYIQGLYELMDTLLARNPGLRIDNCAAGGCRNDIEMLRRSVVLHYTDVGSGVYTVNHYQNHMLYQWIPYFRQATTSWDPGLDGQFDTLNRTPSLVSEFSYYKAMAPIIWVSYMQYRNPWQLALHNKMMPIWEKAAQYQIDGNYYSLNTPHREITGYYAVQFDCPESQDGYFEVVRYPQNTDETITVRLKQLNPAATYCLTEAESGTTVTVSGEALMTNGFPIEIEPRSGVIWFYQIVQ